MVHLSFGVIVFTYTGVELYIFVYGSLLNLDVFRRDPRKMPRVLYIETKYIGIQTQVKPYPSNTLYAALHNTRHEWTKDTTQHNAQKHHAIRISFAL